MSSGPEETDPTEGILFPWSDSEAERITAELISLVGKEPQDAMEGEYFNPETGLWERAKIAGRKHMQSELQAICGNYGIEARMHKRVSATDLTKKLKSIESAAKRLLDALGIDPATPDVLEGISPQELRYALQGQAMMMAERGDGFRNHPPTQFAIDGQSYTDWHQQAQLRDVVVGIRQMQEWAGAARQKWSHRIRPSRTGRHQGDVPLQMLIQDLFGLWISAYHELPKFSRAGPFHATPGAPSGPFFRFVRGVCHALGIDATDEALGSRVAALLGGRRKLVMGHSVLRMGKSKSKKK